MLHAAEGEFGAISSSAKIPNCKPKLASAAAGIVDPSNAAALLCVLHIESTEQNNIRK
jgi:hypothetical protein